MITMLESDGIPLLTEEPEEETQANIIDEIVKDYYERKL